jgi:hypothetical protein
MPKAPKRPLDLNQWAKERAASDACDPSGSAASIAVKASGVMEIVTILSNICPRI